MIKYKFSRGDEIEVHLRVNSYRLKFGSHFEFLYEDEGELQAQIGAIENIPRFRVGNLKEVLFGLLPPSQLETPGYKFINQELDETQMEAVRLCLKQQEIGIIHGPPGTGKTTTLLEIIQQEVKFGKKVLFSAASNTAVDNMSERLAKEDLKIVRW